MNSANDLLIKIETLKNILVSYATGQSQEADNDKYIELRRELVANSSLTLPRFVHTCRSLKEFWGLVKPQFPTYAERREFLRKEFESVLSLLESEITFSSQSSNAQTISFAGDLFKRQFPAGLPFGLKKPGLVFRSEHGSQQAYFEDEPEIGVIRKEVYPNFTYQRLLGTLSGTPIITQSRLSVFPGLYLLCQTKSEKDFFLAYRNKYDMSSEEVPVLIPQAWIQWHSKTKRDLRSEKSVYADELYRVDFVAFWKDKRFAILVDDISHYAKQTSARWDADEEAYSKRLKEDRKLRKEGWQVFRVSNWEIRNESSIPEILLDLREYLDF